MSVPAAYLVVIIVWATTPLAIQWAAIEMGAVTALLLRTLLALMLGVAILLGQRIAFPWHKRALTSYAAGAVGFGVGMLLVYSASPYLASGIVSVMFGLAPLLSGLIAAFVLRERSELTVLRVPAMLLALGGLAYVFKAELSLGDGQLWPLILVVLSVLSFCFSGVWVKKLSEPIHPLAQTMGALLLTLPLLLIAAFIVAEPLPANASIRSWGATLYLAIFGSVLGFMCYFYILQRVPAGQVALSTLVTPVIAVILGTTLNNEQIPPSLLRGSGVILLGLGLYIAAPWLEKRLLTRQFTR